MTKRDEHLWDEEVVGDFLDLDRSGRDYAELEISPANVVCDVRMVHAVPGQESTTSPGTLEGLETRVRPLQGRRGPDDRLDRARASSPGRPSARCPRRRASPCRPRPGDRWRFNVFRVERPGGKAAPGEGRRSRSPGRTRARRASTCRRRSATWCSPPRAERVVSRPNRTPSHIGRRGQPYAGYRRAPFLRAYARLVVAGLSRPGARAGARRRRVPGQHVHQRTADRRCGGASGGRLVHGRVVEHDPQRRERIGRIRTHLRRGGCAPRRARST